MRIFLVFWLVLSSAHGISQSDSLLGKRNLQWTFSAAYGYPDFGYAFIFRKTLDGLGHPTAIDNGTLYFRTERINHEKRLGLSLTAFYSAFSYSEWQGSSHYGSMQYHYYKELGLGARFNYYVVDKQHIAFYLAIGGGGQIPLQEGFSPVYLEAAAGVRFQIRHVGLFFEAGPSKTLASCGLAWIFE